jgi:DNA-binding transcriptional regulator YhcF (GntR family)
MKSGDVSGRLRDQVIGDLHLGRLHSGDRLPGVRETAEEMGVGIRAVVRAYRELEREGLVQIRSRSGVYVAPQERLGGEMLEETASWLAEVLVEALKRRITVPGLPEFVRRCTATVRPRCLLLESTDDHLTVLEHELREEFGFDVEALDLRGVGRGEGGTAVEGLLATARRADLLVTTTYHAAAVRELAESADRPLIVIPVHAAIAVVLERQLRSGSLTVVCVDPAFGDRVRSVYGGAYEHAVRVITTGQSDRLREIASAEPVLLTLAARRQIGETPMRSILPHSPSISPESAGQLLKMLIRLNIAAERADAAG